MDKFLSNPDKIEYEIICVSCKDPLWTTKILKREGTRVVSTETHSMEEVIPPFDRRIKDCPLCGDCFYAIGKNKTSGIPSQMYLIRDTYSGITRLI